MGFSLSRISPVRAKISGASPVNSTIFSCSIMVSTFDFESKSDGSNPSTKSMDYTNIDDVVIDDVLIGTEKVDKFVNEYTKLKAVVTNKTTNSVEVMIYTQKVDGINARQWFMFGDFIKRFKFN